MKVEYLGNADTAGIRVRGWLACRLIAESLDRLPTEVFGDEMAGIERFSLREGDRFDYVEMDDYKEREAVIYGLRQTLNQMRAGGQPGNWWQRRCTRRLIEKISAAEYQDISALH